MNTSMIQNTYYTHVLNVVIVPIPPMSMTAIYALLQMTAILVWHILIILTASPKSCLTLNAIHLPANVINISHVEVGAQHAGCYT